jgi:cytidyltransferase-like protein
VIESLRFVRSVEPTDEARMILPDIPREQIETSPASPPCPDNPQSTNRKVVVTGCFDWLHSGHVRFFEEVSELGDLYVVVGHDANIALLKGHAPMFDQRIRCYLANAIRFVKLAIVSSGSGWMDAAPEFARIKPDIYAVNDDGDRPEKRAFCEETGIEYRVLKRIPKAGLPRRESSQLRGF